MPSRGSITKRALVALGILLGQIRVTGHRPDLPSLTNQDPSADLGEPDSPGLTIALLGDSSITAPGVEPLDDCWARRVGHGLAAKYRVRLVSLAVGGARASDLLKYQLPPALALMPDMALVSVGANDALRSVSVVDYERDLTEILKRLTAEIPAVGVSGVGDLGPLPRLPPIGKSWARVRSRSFDRAIARAAHRCDVPKTVTWGPMWEPFEDPTNGIYAGDLFHASGTGHALFATSWNEVVGVLLKKLEVVPGAGSRSGSPPGFSARPKSSESST